MVRCHCRSWRMCSPRNRTWILVVGPGPPSLPPTPATSVAVLPVREHERRSGQGLFQRRVFRGASERSFQRSASASSSHARRPSPSGAGVADTQAIARALHVHDNRGRQRPRIAQSRADYRAAHRCQRWLQYLVGEATTAISADILSVQAEVARAVAIALTHKIILDRASAWPGRSILRSHRLSSCKPISRLICASRRTGYTGAYPLATRRLRPEQPAFRRRVRMLCRTPVADTAHVRSSSQRTPAAMSRG